MSKYGGTMREQRALHHFVGWVSVFLLFAQACGREPGILVNIAAWPDGVENIRIQTTIGGTQGTDFYVGKDQTRFAVRVPVGSQDTVQLDATGLNSIGCKLATGMLLEPVPDTFNRFVERTLVLSTVSAPRCLFFPASYIGVAQGLGNIAVGDFNSDLKPDLASTTYTNAKDNRLYVLYGNGTGGFDAMPRTVVDLSNGSPDGAPALGSVVVGNFRGDLKQDLAVANFYSNAASVLLGDGKGGFSKPTDFTFSSFRNPFTVAVGDFNGDLKQDLAVANYYGNSVSVVLGDGVGGFSMPAPAPAPDVHATVSVGRPPTAMVVGDFNNDGKPDLAVTPSSDAVGGPAVSVLLGNGAGGFPAVLPFSVGSAPQSVAVADFNGDKKLDLVAVSAGVQTMTMNVPPTVTVLLGNGAGGFRSTSIPLDILCSFVTASDFDGDGKPDLALACGDDPQKRNEVRVLLGDGSGGFGPASIILVGTHPTAIAVGDFNGDKKPDIATSNYAGGGINDISVLLNQFDY